MGVQKLPGNIQSAASFVPSRQSIAYFSVMIGAGVFFIFLAFTMFLPVMALMPQKFAICFTLGCIFIVGSFFALKGPKAQLLHMISKEVRRDHFTFLSDTAITIVFWLRSFPKLSTSSFSVTFCFLIRDNDYCSVFSVVIFPETSICNFWSLKDSVWVVNSQNYYHSLLNAQCSLWGAEIAIHGWLLGEHGRHNLCLHGSPQLPSVSVFLCDSGAAFLTWFDLKTGRF